MPTPPGTLESPFIHAGSAVGHRRFDTGRAPTTRSIGNLFAAPLPGSVWERSIFQPIWDPLDIVQSQFEVMTKAGKVVPFILFETQKRFAQRLGLRNVTVKPRQVGMSTIHLGLQTAVAITTPNVGSLVVTHLDETTETMRRTVKNFIQNLVEHMGWELEFGKDNAEMLEIRPLNSWFYWGTAGGSKDTGVGRSRTIQQFHASEIAHWNTSNPGATLSGITESVPDNGMVYLESTPNGAVGPFYNTFKGRNGYVKHFYPWFVEPSRKLELKGYRLTLTDEEALLASTHHLTDEQIAWRRWKMADLQSQGLEFLQEYPEDEISCFTAGVRGAFPTQRLIQLLRMAEAMPVTVQPGWHFGEPWKGDDFDPGGELKLWSPPQYGHQYIAYGDVGGGHRDGDASVLYVLDRVTGHVVAMLDGRWSPESFGRLSVRVARMYNEAYLAHESNGLGIGAVRAATRELGYRNYHYEPRRQDTKDEDKADMAPGFYITSYSRTPLLRYVIQTVNEGQAYIWDPEAIKEMTSAQLVPAKVGGGWADSIQVPKGLHDDLMAYAGVLALYRLLGPVAPGGGAIATARPMPTPGWS